MFRDALCGKRDSAHEHASDHDEHEAYRPQREQRPGSTVKAADPEAEEGRDQDEVREVRYYSNLGRKPADECELLKESDR